MDVPTRTDKLCEDSSALGLQRRRLKFLFVLGGLVCTFCAGYATCWLLDREVREGTPDAGTEAGSADLVQALNKATQEERAEQERMIKDKGKSYAIDYYRAKAESEPTDPMMRYMASRYASNEGDRERLCRAAVDLAPEFAWAWHCLSFAAQERREGVQALQYAEKANELFDAEDIRKNLSKLSLDWYGEDQLMSLLGETKLEDRDTYWSNHYTVKILRAEKGWQCLKHTPSVQEYHLVCLSVWIDGAKREHSTGMERPTFQVCQDDLLFRNQHNDRLRSEGNFHCRTDVPFEAVYGVEVQVGQVISKVDLRR